MKLIALIVGASILLVSGIVAAAAQPSPAPRKSTTFAGGLDRSWLDPTAKPCDDFFQYATGGWRASHTIPPDYPRWGTFSELALRNQKELRGILEKAAADKKAPAGSITRRLGDFYASAMDMKTRDALGVKPLQGYFKKIDNIKNMKELAVETARLQRLGANVLFRIGSHQDAKDATKMIAWTLQGGLGLPDRDYYLKEDKRSKAMREAYIKHIARSFELAGVGSEKAKANADLILRLETALAKSSMSRVKMRDPKATYNPMSVEDFKRTAPKFPWNAFLNELGLSGLKELSVAQPDFFKALSGELSDIPIDSWKTYLRWHLLSEASSSLSTNFIKENFAFTKGFTGAKKLRPAWRRAVSATDGALGDDLGQIYVKEYFSPESKKRALAILHNVKEALREDLETLAWMSPATRQQALVKLSMIEEKIGYTTKWKDYSSVKINRKTYLENVFAANRYEFRRDLEKIGKPVDRTEWGMIPPTVNAYYDPPMNQIVFPAGILQHPFFDPARDDAYNYGAIGAVMGHEITHGFDDKGSQYDGHGNLKNWWAPEDLKKFKERGERIVAQADAYSVGDGQRLKGKLVEGEAIADLGGVTLALRAYHRSLKGKKATVLEGFTGDQRFFLGFAGVWAQNTRPAFAHFLATVDPHPPAPFRVNNTLSNVPAFARAFGCESECTMAYPEDKTAQIW